MLYVGRCSRPAGARGARVVWGAQRDAPRSSPDSTSELSYSVCTCIRGQLGVQPGGGAGRARRVGAQRDAPRRHRIRQVSYRTRSVHVYVGRCSARRGARGARVVWALSGTHLVVTGFDK
ncbi:unnamed protein product [Arctia plantaginis]|uniref:Uncharacterized protein n=1 Tax=Arctia plantaginis TaxID=874455 RepID=A0A8S0YZL4_ARCPL|nr:unnamed protein product [Arctia plantaginis]